MTVNIKPPQSNAKNGDAAMRKEYSRLRSIARKRLERLGKSEFAETAEYQLNKSHYPKLEKIQSSYELANRLTDLQKFLAAKGSTVTGQKRIQKAKLETLHEHGYTFVNKGNIREFGEFMQFMRSLYPKRPSAESGELSAEFTTYKTLRSGDLTPVQIERIFKRYMEKIHPTSLYLQKGVRPIPNGYKYQLD